MRSNTDDGEVMRSNGRAGSPRARSTAPAPAITSEAGKLEPYEPERWMPAPRNSSVATQRPSPYCNTGHEERGEFHAAVLWKPATNSFSASGRSKGTRLVSAKAAMMNRMKLMMLKGKT
jgi:hypothetical protein